MISLCLGEEHRASGAVVYEARFVGRFAAASWDEARQKRDELMGWA